MLTGSGQATTAVVLCGGRSTRMGSDKGLLEEGEKTWVEIAAEKLEALQLPVLVSINPQQQQAYAQIFPEEQLVIDGQDLHVKGPLLGLLSVHAKLPGHDLLVLACDMKDITTRLLQNLYEQFKRERSEVLVYATEQTVQPLCGIYSAAALKKIYTAVQEESLQKFSMMHVLQKLRAKHVDAKDEDLQFFNNYNSLSEL